MSSDERDTNDRDSHAEGVADSTGGKTKKAGKEAATGAVDGHENELEHGSIPEAHPRAKIKIEPPPLLLHYSLAEWNARVEKAFNEQKENLEQARETMIEKYIAEGTYEMTSSKYGVYFVAGTKGDHAARLAGYCNFKTPSQFQTCFIDAAWFANLKASILAEYAQSWIAPEDKQMADAVGMKELATPGREKILKAMNTQISISDLQDPRAVTGHVEPAAKNKATLQPLISLYAIKSFLRLFRAAKAMPEMQPILSGPGSPDRSTQPGDFGWEAEDINRFLNICQHIHRRVNKTKRITNVWADLPMFWMKDRTSQINNKQEEIFMRCALDLVRKPSTGPHLEGNVLTVMRSIFGMFQQISKPAEPIMSAAIGRWQANPSETLSSLKNFAVGSATPSMSRVKTSGGNKRKSPDEPMEQDAAERNEIVAQDEHLAKKHKVNHTPEGTITDNDTAMFEAAAEQRPPKWLKLT